MKPSWRSWLAGSVIAAGMVSSGRTGGMETAAVLAQGAGALVTGAEVHMKFDYDVAVPMSDGVVLRANVFRPDDAAAHPVIITMSPYGKDYDFKVSSAPQWRFLTGKYPTTLCARSSCTRWVWETVDPELWVPDGYAIVRVDARGSGRSPGVADHLSTRQATDYAEAIEWAGVQPWSSGKVGTLGISYYSWMSWLAAAQNPKHLAATLVWEGASDWYREIAYHGGIMVDRPFGVSGYPNQHGLPQGQYVSASTKALMGPERGNGPEVLSENELMLNRVDTNAAFKAHPLNDSFYRARTPNLANIKVPILMAGNWGGHGLHGRGEPEAYNRVATPAKDKWLEMHVGEHWEEFYIDSGGRLQKSFLGHYLKGLDNGWDKQPHVQVEIRTPSSMKKRMEQEYPLARTEFTNLYLDATGAEGRKRIAAANPDAGGRVSYEPMRGVGAQFLTEPMPQDMEILGPVSARLWISSVSRDADLFVALHAYDPAGKEITFQGANDPRGPVSHGWLRASHRRIDPKLSLPGRPWHTHDVVQKLNPGQIYPVDVEIWPTSMVFPKGYRLGLTVDGTDYVGAGGSPIWHTDPDDRPEREFGGTVTVYTGGDHQSYVTLPIIPVK